MATTKLAEKPVVNILDDEVRIFITTKENVDGAMVDSIRRTTFPALIEVLKAKGIDKSHFDEMRYDADSGKLHVLLDGKDVITPCYIGKFAELDENGVIPDEYLPEFNKGGTLYANDVPLYGTRFVDVTESGEIIIREDGSGDYLLTLLEDGTAMAVKVKTHVVNSLDSDSETKALSAKQGKILGGWIGKVGELLTTAKTSVVEAINELLNSLNAHKNATNNPHAVSKSQIGLDNVDNVKQAAKTDFEAHTSNAANPHKVTKAQVGLGNADNTADANKNVLSATKLTAARKINGVDFGGTGDITIEDNTKIPLSQKGAAEGVAELDTTGIVPDKQLPYYNKTQNVYVDGQLLYPGAFFDVDSEGNFYLREDGRGEYLLYIPLDGVPRLKYIGNAVTDDVTGVSYSFSISDGKAVLKQIL